MRIFANLFLILFLADGGFSLVDELVSLLTPLMPFTALRNLLAVVVILLSVPIYLSLGIDRRLPKRIFLPPVVFVLWSIVSTWFFPSLAELRMYGLLLAAAQVAIGMLPLTRFRKGNERCLTMPPALFAAPSFSLRNTLFFCGANLIVIPLVLLIFAFTVADANMAEYTAGFMHLTPGGLSMTERVYTRGNRTIRLAAMIHIGDKEYYDAVGNPVTAGRSIVLAEGVSDDKHLLHNRIDYGKMAGFLGLTSQDKLLFRGRLIGEDEFASPRSHASASPTLKPPGTPDILRADVDVSAFRQPTITFLNAVGKQLRQSPSFVTGLLALNAWSEKNLTPDMNEVIMDDILHRRNLGLLSHLDKALERYDTVIIPWGALHMKEIEAAVLKSGFVLQKEQERVSIDFRRLLL
ncbi:MAG: hypothetical protein M0T70_09525 [Geobacteraceae bacterium]|nr:hypothetical protein [Geobacteraceae bacterium]